MRTERHANIGLDEAFHNIANTPKNKEGCVTYELEYEKFVFLVKSSTQK